MARKTLPVKAFEGGLNNKKNPTDIEDNQASNMVNTMVDTVGAVRLMGGETFHELELINAGLSGEVNPGRGIFSFPSDYTIAGVRKEEGSRNLLAIQDHDAVGIYDGDTMHEREIKIAHSPAEYDISSGTLGGSDSNINTEYYYDTFTGLRVCDSNFSNDNHYTKLYKPFGKTWFSGAINNTSGVSVPGTFEAEPDSTQSWISLNSYIFPPSVASDGANTHQLYSVDGFGVDLEADANFRDATGCIGMKVQAIGAEDSGAWVPDSALKFGISFQYDDGQESTVSPFSDGDKKDTSSGAQDHSLSFIMYANMGESTAFNADEPNDNAFDPRIQGVNLYLTGTSEGNFDDPRHLAFWDWGSSDTDTATFTSHENVSKNTVTKNATYTTYYTEALEINGPSEFNYRLKNAVANAYPESTAARYNVAEVSGQVVYIGGVQRYKFLTDTLSGDSFRNCIKQCSIEPFDPNNDRVLISQPGRLDTFTEEGFIDIASSDGEYVTALKLISDRLMLFKQKTLYIINMAGELAIVEYEGKYMGVNSSSKVVHTDFGVVWINATGCYLYTGEGDPISLSAGKLNERSGATNGSFGGLNEFGSENSCIGYIPVKKQLMVFKNAEGSGDILIYDFQTESWAFGLDKVSSMAKSNMISNYDDSCIFMGTDDGDGQSLYTANGSEEIGKDAEWVIKNLGGGQIANETAIKIGSYYIFGNANGGFTWFPGSTTAQGYTEFIQIVEGSINLLFGSADHGGVNPELGLTAVREDDDLRIIADTLGTLAPTLNGQNLTFDNAPTQLSNIATIGPAEVSLNLHIGIHSNNKIATLRSNNDSKVLQLAFLILQGGYSVKGNFDNLGPPGQYDNIAVPNLGPATPPAYSVKTESSYRSYLKVTSSSAICNSGATTVYFDPWNNEVDLADYYSAVLGTSQGSQIWESKWNSAGYSENVLRPRWPFRSGQANGSGEFEDPQTGNALTSSQNIADAALSAPGVVFVKSDGELLIKVWGDHSGVFTTNKNYTITGTPDNINDIADPGISFDEVTTYGAQTEDGFMGFTLLRASSASNHNLMCQGTGGEYYTQAQATGVMQSFTATNADKLSGISIHLTGTDNIGDSASVITASIKNGTGDRGSAFDSSTITFPAGSGPIDGWIEIPFDSPQSLVSGNIYTVKITATNIPGGALICRKGNDYTGGNIIEGTDTILFNTNLGFKVYTGPFLSNTAGSMYTMAAAKASDALVTFGELDNTVSIDNSSNDYIAPKGQMHLIHIDRGFTPDQPVSMRWSIADYGGVIREKNYIFQPSETTNAIATLIKDDIYSLIDPSDPGTVIPIQSRWRDTYLLTVTSGGSSGNFTVLHISNKGVRFKIDQNLKGQGVMPGDSFRLTGTGLTTDEVYYRISALTEHGVTPTGTIDSGYTYVDIHEVDQPSMLIEGVIQNGSHADITADTALSSVVMTFNTVAVEGRLSDMNHWAQTNILQVTSSVSTTLNVMSFNNIDGLSSDSFLYTTKHYDMGDAGIQKRFLGANATILGIDGDIKISIIVDEETEYQLETNGEFPVSVIDSNFSGSIDLSPPNGKAIPFRTIAIKVYGDNGPYQSIKIDNLNIHYRSLNR